MIKATDYEYRRQTLIHLFVLTVSFLTYLIDRDDIVWSFVQGKPHPGLLERLLFSLAAAFIGVSALIRTWALAYPECCRLGHGSGVRGVGPYRYIRYPEQLGKFLFSIGLGFFAPLSGFIILVTAEAILSFRLIRCEQQLRSAETHQPSRPDSTQPLLSQQQLLPGPGLTWMKAFRQESAKWGLFLTSIVFIFLLEDRVAEILAGVSFLVWVLLNPSAFSTQVPRRNPRSS